MEPPGVVDKSLKIKDVTKTERAFTNTKCACACERAKRKETACDTCSYVKMKWLMCGCTVVGVALVSGSLLVHLKELFLTHFWKQNDVLESDNNQTSI